LPSDTWAASHSIIVTLTERENTGSEGRKFEKWRWGRLGTADGNAPRTGGALDHGHR